MMPKKKNVIQQVIVLLAVFATFCSWPAVSDSLKGAAEQLIDERLQTERLFKTAESTPPSLTSRKANSSKIDMYSSASVWSPKEADAAWLQAWQECTDINCVLEYMKKSGASDEALYFTGKIVPETFGSDGYLDIFEEKGRVDLGSVFFPTRANTNGALVFLNGSPSLVSSEQRSVEQLDISGDSNYPMLKKQYPRLQIWGAGAGFVSAHADTNGGQRFILDYALVNYCHACYVGWQAQVAFEFSKDGTFKGTKFLKLVQDKSFAGSSGTSEQINLTTDWLKLTGPWSQDCDGTFRAIAVPPSNPNTIYIGSSHSTKGCGFYKSIDSGKTWRPINDGFPKIGSVQSIQHYPAVSKIVVSPSDSSFLYAGTFVDSGIGLVGNVYKSLDGGDSWVKASGKVSLVLRQPEIKSPVLDIAIDPRNPNTAYVGLVRDGVYKTTDGGDNWDQVKKASVAIGATDIFSFVKITDSNPDVLYIGGFTGVEGYSLLFCFEKECDEVNGVQPLGAFKSIDGGKNWLVISNPTPPQGNSLVPALITDLVVDPSNYNLIYASTMAYKFPSVFNFNANNKGVHKSEDGGTTWQAINNSSLGNLSQFPLYKLIIDSTKSTQLYLVAGLNGVFRSSNGGTNWEQITKSGMASDTYVITAALAENRLFALSTSGVYVISIAPLQEAIINTQSVVDTASTHPLNDTTIKSMITNRLKVYIPIDLIGNYMSGTNGVVEEIEILEKSYEKEQLNAIGKAFLGEPKNYWGVV